MTIGSIKRLPRREKLKLMDALWDDLSRPDHKFESPEWHGKELAKTARRLKEGKEQILDWEASKKKLRAEFE